MGILANDEQQLTYIFSSSSKLGKNILGHVESLEEPVRTIDIDKQKIGDTVWVDIADMVGVELGELFAPNHPDAPDVGDANNFDTNDWLKIIEHNPGLLQKPIGIQGEKAKVFAQEGDIMKFYTVDSAGLEKTFHTEPPTTKKKTEDQEFVPPSEEEDSGSK